MAVVKRNIAGDFKKDGIDIGYDDAFSLVCKKTKIDFDRTKRFVYFIDTEYVMDSTKGFRNENLTPDYKKVIDCGLEQMKYTDHLNEKFCRSYNNVCDGLIYLAKRIIRELKKFPEDESVRIGWFENLIEKPAKGFEEGIQRMLFINQMFWQTDHRLVGLGAWDSFLFPLYKKNLDEGLIDRDKTLEILKDLLQILHENYKFKSNVLMGDTGQILVLGKSDTRGNYICNDLTYLFVEAMKEVQQPEPKILLRVNKNTPRDLISLSLDSIITGIGAPLFANDDRIVPALTEFGIRPEDACQYATSACWEPLIGGMSSSNNNMTPLNFLKGLDNLLKREPLGRITDYETLVETYLKYLRRNVRAVERVISRPRFQYDPLLSVFTRDCFENRKDVSWGGARYHNLGMTSVAMGNLINILLNIKELVFEQKKYTLVDVKKAVILNFPDEYKSLREELKSEKSRFGVDDPKTIALVNRISATVSDEINDYRSYMGGKLKFGLSGSAYMDAARGFGASFDGRKAGEPFNVHISNEDNNGFTEIINFASALECDNNRFNGNVVDLMVSPDFIRNNREKFLDLLMAGIKVGFFELQMNVVSSRTLIAARKDPDKFPNLIVRVWGFSAYFKDLPDEYKDVLIERALKNENAA